MLFRSTGKGIPKDSPLLKNIFKPFFTTKDDGTGLGLAISSKIIEQHNGTIEINSDIGKGTEIIVRI